MLSEKEITIATKVISGTSIYKIAELYQITILDIRRVTAWYIASYLIENKITLKSFSESTNFNIRTLKKYMSEIRNPELVINRIRPNMVKKGEMMDVDDIVDLLSIDLIGVVPDDEYIITQTNKGEPVIQNKRAPSGKAYIEIAKRVLGEKIEVTIPGREKGFFAKLKRLFKKQ